MNRCRAMNGCLKRNGFLFSLLILFILTGCSVPKDVAYFQDLNSEMVLATAKREPIRVRPEDKISIVVKTKDPVLSELFNLPVYSNRIGNAQSVNGSGSEVRGYVPSGENVAAYTVTPDGDIDFPVLGKIHIAGMTRSELSGFIKGELMGRDLVKDPTVVVEFLSSGVSVMGEVNRPGRYDMNRDNLNILEALTLAGDLTINGQRKNVRVIREENGEIHSYVLDLTDAASLIKSPGYYLQQNDVIYVEPNKIMKRSTNVNGNNTMSLGFWMSVASVLVSVVTTVAVLVNK